MKRKGVFIPGWAFWNYDFEYLRGCFRDFLDIKIVKPFKNDIIELFEKEKEKLIVLGWSLGGMVVIDLFKRIKDKIAGIVFVNTCYKFIRSKKNERDLKALVLGIKKDAEFTIKRFIQSVLYPFTLDSTANKDFITKDYNKDELLWGLDFLREKNLEDNLQIIDVPVLIVHGEKDIIIDKENSKELRERLKHSKLVIFGDQGHGIPLICPERLAEEVKVWINSMG